MTAKKKERTEREIYVSRAINILRGEDAKQVLREEFEKEREKEKVRLQKKPSEKPKPEAVLLKQAELLLAKELKGVKEFGFARRVLSRELDRMPAGSLKLKFHQEKAVCTYKDPDLPTERRLRDALKILREAEDLTNTKNQETLGITGSIHKRLWEFNNQKQNLEDAMLFYRRGREEGVANDQGYTGINEAYLLDLLASLEDKDTKATKRKETKAAESDAESEADDMREQAKKIRLEIIEKVAPLADTEDGAWLKNEWWYYSTIGEAHFGLKDYDKAAEWLVDRKPETLKVAEWEYESTARQLASLAHIQLGAEMSDEEFAETDAGKVLKKFFGNDNMDAVRSAFIGKIGLALSGGGFRAALFHIGVLARLAELDLLRRVEVLSCVSGGSIVGAHYYLQVRELLETKPDREINKHDYIKIVQDLEKQFLGGVQRNVRTRVATSLLTNLKMIFKPHYSRTLRVGELYESQLYSKVKHRSGDEHQGDERYINDLRIRPKLPDGQQDSSFNPQYHNWKRGAKAPILIINAATLNTGHSWHFTVTYMGEPPGSINPEIDANYRLRRMYYSDAPRKPTDHQKVRLGHAVAASSCVPGLFEPLALDDLYEDVKVRVEGNNKKHLPEELRVRLVDGGVCDNQGVVGLSEQECRVMLVSDASGQMEAEATPGSGLFSVPMRSLSVLQARVREAQYRDLRERRRSGLLRGLMFVHLKQGLKGKPLNWRECPSHREVSDFDPVKTHQGDIARYGVAKDVQRALAAIRTDMDSFCDVEADALMASAYLMTRYQLERTPPQDDVEKNVLDEDERVCIDGVQLNSTEARWRFLNIAPYLKPSEAVEGGTEAERDRKKREDLKKIIGSGKSLAFKIWKLSPVLKVLSWVIVLSILALAVWGVFLLFGGSSATPEIINAAQSSNAQASVRPLWVTLLIIVVALAGIYYAGKKWLGVVRWSDTLTSIILGIVMTFPGFIVAWLHLKVFDKLYLRWGSRERFYNGEADTDILEAKKQDA